MFLTGRPEGRSIARFGEIMLRNLGFYFVGAVLYFMPQ
jgi:hypothetical protein